MDQGAEQGPSQTPPPAMNFVSFLNGFLSAPAQTPLCEREASLLRKHFSKLIVEGQTQL